MPKDASKNVDRYKVRGGQLNEFELAENRKALAEKKPKGNAKLIPGTPPEDAVDWLRPSVKAKASKATTSTTVGKAKKAAKSARANPSKGATAKKLAARKAAAKK
jgi:hypothetical protein